MDFLCPEKSSFKLKLALTDDDGSPLTPIDSISWWVGKPRSTTPIIEKTEVVSPAADSEIIVPAEASICTGRGNEKRFVIVRVENGLNVGHQQFDYEVENLNLVPY